MVSKVIRTIFLLKRGPEAQWVALNPVLHEGEPGFVTDRNKLKIGDGETAWNDLPYIGGSASIAADGKSITINTNEELELYGFENAETGQVPAKADDGKIKWVEPSGDERIPDSEIHNIIDN